MQASQHALDVAIENRRPLSGADADDRPGGRAPDTWQGRQCLDTLDREGAAMLSDHLLSGLVQIARPGVVAKPRPQVQHLIDLRRRQRRDIREALHEARVIGQHRRDLGLLEHDLRDPHTIRGGVLLPGQVLAAMLIEPVEHAGLEFLRAQRNACHAWRGVGIRRRHVRRGRSVRYRHQDFLYS